MNQLRRSLLVGVAAGAILPGVAAFAQQKHGRSGGGYLPNGGEDVLHLPTGAEHSLKGVRLEMLLHLPVFLLQGANLAGHPEDYFQILHLDGFDQKVKCPGVNGLQRVPLLALARDDDHFDQAVQGQHLGQRGHAFVGQSRLRRHAQVQQHYRRPVIPAGGDRAGAVLGQHYVIILSQRPLHLQADHLIIINYK